MNGPKYYILDGHTPVPCDLLEWAEPNERRTPDNDPWRVDRTDLGDGVSVSTVFLGLDHQWHPDGVPLLFETMVFGLPDGDEVQEHCSTWEQAVIQHAEVVTRYREARGDVGDRR